MGKGKKGKGWEAGGEGGEGEERRNITSPQFIWDNFCTGNL